MGNQPELNRIAMTPHRELPEPDRFAVCPFNGPILPFYRGVFESVFVLLHPFIRPTSLTVEELESVDLPWRPTVIASCEPVRWSEIQLLAGFASLAEVDIALRTQIFGLNENYANPALANTLHARTTQAGIIPPVEGRFADITHNKVLSFIQEQGQRWLWVGDEHCTERTLYWIDELKEPTSTVTLGRCSAFTPDKTLLWTTHWDSHFSFLCGTKEMTRLLASDSRFEGFECDAETDIYWSIQSEGR